MMTLNDRELLNGRYFASFHPMREANYIKPTVDVKNDQKELKTLKTQRA